MHSSFKDPDSGMSTYLSVRTRRISRGMMTMLLSLIFCLLASTFAANDTCPANPNSPSCDDPVEETICQLTCNRDSGECAQSDEAKCGEIGVDLASETYPDMYPTRCKAICEESRDNAESPESVCRFYKVMVSSLRVSFNCTPFM